LRDLLREIRSESLLGLLDRPPVSVHTGPELTSRIYQQKLKRSTALKNYILANVKIHQLMHIDLAPFFIFFIF
jgi:hypothetical protein